MFNNGKYIVIFTNFVTEYIVAKCNKRSVLHELYPENIIIVYEPSPRIASLWLEREKDKKLLASQNIHVLTGKDGVDQMFNMYVWFITDGNYKIVQIKRVPSYENLWKEEEKLVRRLNYGTKV